MVEAKEHVVAILAIIISSFIIIVVVVVIIRGCVDLRHEKEKVGKGTGKGKKGGARRLRRLSVISLLAAGWVERVGSSYMFVGGD